MKKKVLLIGGRSKARSMALSLLEQGYKVSYVSENFEACMDMAAIEGVTVVHGDGTKPFILDEAGAGECEFSIALGARDADNLVASEICKKQFKIRKTVSILSDPRKTQFFYNMGVDSVVCTIETITSIIEQQTFIDEMASVVPIVKGHVQIVEVRIPEESHVNGKKLWEIDLPQEVVIGCILRGEETIIPRGDTRISEGDILVVIAGNGQELAAVKELTRR